MMELEVGMRVVRAAGEYGFVASTKKLRCWMVEVRWESSGIKQWIPADLVTPCPLVDAPPVRPLTPWGNTTPHYLMTLQRQLRRERNPDPEKTKQWEASQLADRLLSLSGKRKNRSRQKAKKIIDRFNKKFGN